MRRFFGFFKKIGWKWSLALITVVVGGLWFLYFINFSGRSASRLLGDSFAQKLVVKNMASVDDILSVSLDYRETYSTIASSYQKEATIKNVTFVATDGEIYTAEFKDAMIVFEGMIHWTRGSGSLFRTRTFSRVFGGAIKYPLPDDFAKIINVDIERSNADGVSVKNLAYITTDGKAKVREYREGILDRNFEGAIEIVAGAKKDSTKTN